MKKHIRIILMALMSVCTLQVQALTNGRSNKIHEIFFPYCSASYDLQLFITKVYWENGYTVLDITSYNEGKYENCSIYPHTYLMVDGKKYKMSKAEGIALSPGCTDYPNAKGLNASLSFKLYFYYVPITAQKMTFFEDIEGGWRLEDILLDNPDRIVVTNGNVILTSDHKWELKTVQITDKQTIIGKVVTPTDTNTYMQSSQEEYIEDADTGCKYYLLNSNLGFENNPTLSYDKNPIEFYELYPALPKTVKRIHISTGDRYYIKNLVIRK